ncbi:MAG: ABC transporter ATP-binding protein [Burkholderiales bacterium]
MLKVGNLQVSYGGINAVKGISFEVNDGELVCLIGANGAGKTTTLKALCGLIPFQGGSAHYAKTDLRGLAPHQLIQHGIALVPEGRGVFARMGIEENLLMGAFARSDHAEIKADLEKIYALFPRLKERRAQIAGTLSGGEQQMLAIGRAIMSRPKLLLLDEPSMGLSPIMVQKIFEVIRDISHSGVTILLVEQNARLALEVSSRGYVLDGGRISLTDDSHALLNNPQVRHAYLGE